MKNTFELNNSEKWHIIQVYKCREELDELIAQGESLTSEKAVKLANNLTYHCMRANLM
ncbi:MAG: hypothetical protein Q4C00_05365 [Bacillota bacterium]|nr:hypothetical protein [Bacillota bacterium]